MGVYGVWQAASITTTDSDVVDLGRDYDFLEIQIPAMVACTISIKVSEKASGTTWYSLGDGITTAAGTHTYADVFKLGGWQFIKVIASADQTTVRLIRVRGMRY